MKIEDAKKYIDELSKKASTASDSQEAVRYAQAACNVANAASVLFHLEPAK